MFINFLKEPITSIDYWNAVVTQNFLNVHSKYKTILSNFPNDLYTFWKFSLILLKTSNFYFVLYMQVRINIGLKTV